MGLVARWTKPRGDKPTYSERGGDFVGRSGSSQTKTIIYRPPGGIGAYQTFYTVPSGKVFMLKSIANPTNTVRVNNLDTYAAGEIQTFDQPTRYEAGNYFSAWANVAGAIVKITGVEEDLSVAAERNRI